jgi:2-haloalkanoic acid dehalogenase type II
MIDWTSVKALSFDCYGTLIDWEQGILNALKPWVTQFDARTVLAGFRAVEPNIEHSHPTWPYRDIVSEVYRQMAAEFQVESSDTDAFAFAVSVGTWPPFADTVAALKVLKKRFRLYILSNVDEVSISGTLAQLETSFDGVFTAEAIGAYKPDPKNFDYLLKRVASQGVAPAQLVHVAQSQFHDLAPAKNIGLQTVWVDRNQGRQGATPQLAHLPEHDLRVTCLSDLVDHIPA